MIIHVAESIGLRRIAEVEDDGECLTVWFFEQDEKGAYRSDGSASYPREMRVLACDAADRHAANQ